MCGQSQWCEHFGPHEVAIALARRPRDHVIEDAVAKVRVVIALAWRRDRVAVAQNRFIPGRRAIRLVLVEELVMERQPCGVVCHPSHRCRVRTADSNLDLGVAEVVVDRPIEIDQPALLQDHQPGGSDRLRDGRQRVKRVRCSGDAVLTVGPAEALFPHDASVARHGHRHRRHLPLGHLLRISSRTPANEEAGGVTPCAVRTEPRRHIVSSSFPIVATPGTGKVSACGGRD